MMTSYQGMVGYLKIIHGSCVSLFLILDWAVKMV